MSDRLFGGVVTALSLLFLVFAVPAIGNEWQSGAGARYFAVGPKLFPYLAGGLTLLFGALITLTASAEQKPDLLQTPQARSNVMLAIAIVLVFVALLEPLGFIISGCLALIGFLIGFGERRAVLIIPLAVCVPLVIHLIFLKAFSLELPSGPIELPF